MRLNSLCKAAIAKWGTGSQLHKTVEELNECGARIITTFFISEPPVPVKEAEYQLACEVADVETMLTQISIIFGYPYKVPSLEEPETYETDIPGDNEMRQAVICLNTGSVAILRNLMNPVTQKYVDDWFNEVQPHINVIKSTITPDVMFKARLDKADKFANYLG